MDIQEGVTDKMTSYATQETETIKFLCERCHHESTTKGNLMQHLQKKKACPTTYSSSTREDIIKKMKRVSEKEKTFECDYCEQKFSTAPGKCKHKKICTKRPNNEANLMALQQRVDQLEQELSRQRNQNNGGIVNNTNNIQNQQIINNTYVINSFGNEIIPQFSPEFLTNCLLNPSKGLTNLIEQIHYNEAIPENHNLRYKSTKNKTLEKLVDHTWHECDASNTLDELIKKGYKILTHFCTQNAGNWYDDEAKVSMYEKFMFLGDKKSKDYSAVKRDLLLLVKDKTLYFLAPNGTDINQEEINEIVTEVRGELDENGASFD